MTKKKKPELTPVPFYLVWNPERSAPTHKHDTLKKASVEAERLAQNNRGTFYVMAAICSAKLTTLEKEAFHFDAAAEAARVPFADLDLDSDIPF